MLNNFLLFLFDSSKYDFNLKITYLLLIASVIGIILLILSYKDVIKLTKQKNENENKNKE